MMSVGATGVGKIALGPGLDPALGAVAVVDAAELDVPVLVVPVVAVLGADEDGKGIAPEVALKGVPGGAGGGPVVVVAIVEGEVEVVVSAALDGAD